LAEPVWVLPYLPLVLVLLVLLVLLRRGRQLLLPLHKLPLLPLKLP
jgi:hypothetical protein